MGRGKKIRQRIEKEGEVAEGRRQQMGKDVRMRREGEKGGKGEIRSGERRDGTDKEGKNNDETQKSRRKEERRNVLGEMRRDQVREEQWRRAGE